MTQDFTLANASLVLPDEIVRGSIRVENGVITDMAQGSTLPAGALDCGGDYVAPGLIELHTDNLERHIRPRPQVDWPHNAAIIAHDVELAGTGITTVFDAMRVGSIPSRNSRYGKYARSLASELLDLRDRGALRISHFLHLRAEICSETLIEELAEFGPEDRVGLVSLMDHTPGQRQFHDLEKMKTYVMGKHNYTDAEFADHITNLRSLRARLGEVHEQAAVAEGDRLGAVLASHDDTTAEQVATSHGHGVRLAEFPTTVEAAQACKAHGIAVIAGAPNLVRGGSHSGNVAARDLAERDLLDILSSDYVPSALLTAAWQLSTLWDDIPRALATVSRTPARASGTDDRGEIGIGKRADLIRFDILRGFPHLSAVWSLGSRVS